MSSLAQRGDGVLGVEVEAHVELDAADGREVVALGIEEQAGEQRFGGLARRRLAGAHDPVDVGEGLVAVLGLVGLQRVADPRAGVDVVDVEQVELVDAGLVELLEVLGRNFVARLDVDSAGALVDQVVAPNSGRRFPRSGSAASSRPSLAALLAARGLIFWPAGNTTSPVLASTMSKVGFGAAPLLGDERAPASRPRRASR